jgi:hypothetical protein
MTALVLGTIAFTEWELPEQIPFGGAQQIASHRMIGGKTSVDAMGPDDAPIAWSGRFLGATAELRARRVDLLRRSGRAVLLTWSSFVYRVVVTKFNAEYFNGGNITYSIQCTVIEDLVSDALGPVVQRLEDGLRDTIAAAFGSTGGDPVLDAAVTGVHVAVTNTLTSGRPTLAGLTVSAQAGLQAAGAQAFAASQVRTDSANAALGGADAIQAGGDPTTMAAGLEAQTAAAQGAYHGQRTTSALGVAQAQIAVPLPPPPAPRIPAVPVDPLPLGAGFL